MHLKQSDLFTGLGHNFLKEAMAVAENVSLDKGDFVFRMGDPPEYFFILIKGQISLRWGDAGEVVYLSTGIGEIFGCSSLIGHDRYFFSARCEAPSVLLRIDRQKMQKILSDDIENGFLFYKQLCGAIGHRLIQMYEQFAQAKQIVEPD